MLKKTLIGSVVILIVFSLIGYLLPAKYEASRTIEIIAPVEVVFDYVNTVARNEAWSPWLAADPKMKITYNDMPAGVGARYEWEGIRSGKGSSTITESIANEKIGVDLDFGQDGVAKGFWTFVSRGDTVVTTWGMRGDAGLNPLARYFGFMLDRMVGPHFEDGLTRLKKVSERK